MIKTVKWLLVAATACVVVAQDNPAFPERAAPEPGLSVEQIDEKLADLQRQMEALEQKKAEAERLAERQEQLSALHNESKERIKDADSQLADMAVEEQPATPAQHARCDGRRKFLNDSKSLSIKILAIKDPQALEQAQQHREELESLETKWSIVEAPTLDAAGMLESLAKDLEQDENQYRQEIFAKLRQLADQDAEGRSQELAIVSARREREKVRQTLIQDFYKGP